MSLLIIFGVSVELVELSVPLSAVFSVLSVMISVEYFVRLAPWSTAPLSIVCGCERIRPGGLP